MQQDDRDTLGAALISQAQASHGQLHAGIGTQAGLDAIDIFTEVAAALGTEQGDGK